MDRIGQLRNFIATRPDDPFPRYALALELKGAGDARGAATELQDLLARNPDYLAAYLQLGMLLTSLDRARPAGCALAKQWPHALGAYPGSGDSALAVGAGKQGAIP